MPQRTQAKETIVTTYGQEPGAARLIHVSVPLESLEDRGGYGDHVITLDIKAPDGRIARYFLHAWAGNHGRPSVGMSCLAKRGEWGKTITRTGFYLEGLHDPTAKGGE